VTQAFSGKIDRLDINTAHSAQRVIAAAVVGGTTSVISGGKFGNGAVTGAFSRALNDEHKHGETEAQKQITDKIKIGAELKNRLMKTYGDSDGKLKFSKDLKAVTLTVNEAGDILVSAQGGVFKGTYELGAGLDSLGLKVPGAELKFSNFSQNGLKWSVSVPKTFWRIEFKGTYSDTINFDPIGAVRHNGIFSDYFNKAHDPCVAYPNSGC